MLKNPDVKNVNKNKNTLTPLKLESKKQDKKKHSPHGWDLVSFHRTIRRSHAPTRFIIFIILALHNAYIFFKCKECYK